MAGKDDDESESHCAPVDSDIDCCCMIESVISIDDRGQMALPKDIRHKAGIRAGDKLAIIN